MSAAATSDVTASADDECPDGLTYVDDSQPGFGRVRCGRGFSYRDLSGATIRDPDELARLRTLAVPPAWTDVWLCPDRTGHIQATGRDAKGRKQYRYHAAWEAHRNDTKFASLHDFGLALSALRAQVDADMGGRRLSFQRVVATTVWLLDHTMVRIGNRKYAGDSYGLTTLLDDHAEIGSSRVRLVFTGKSGTLHDVAVSDRRVANIVRQCQDLPGQRLLQYVDDDHVGAVESQDVNEYIREVTGTDLTAKTFRTWGASVAALGQLRELPRPQTAAEEAAMVRDAIKDVARRLRNTPTVCRTSYVHPGVIDAHADGTLSSLSSRRRRGLDGLDDDEVRLVRLLERS